MSCPISDFANGNLQAARAYDAAARRIRGPSASCNFPLQAGVAADAESIPNKLQASSLSLEAAVTSSSAVSVVPDAAEVFGEGKTTRSDSLIASADLSTATCKPTVATLAAESMKCENNAEPSKRQKIDCDAAPALETNSLLETELGYSMDLDTNEDPLGCWHSSFCVTGLDVGSFTADGILSSLPLDMDDSNGHFLSFTPGLASLNEVMDCRIDSQLGSWEHNRLIET